MFSIPLISAVPIPGLFGGTLEVPAVGAFLAVVLIAALVGSALGVLREATSPHPGAAADSPDDRPLGCRPRRSSCAPGSRVNCLLPPP